MKVMRCSTGFFRIVFGPLAVAFCGLTFVVVPASGVLTFQNPHNFLQLLFSFGPAMIILGEGLYGIRGYDLLLPRLLRVVVVAWINPRGSVPLSGPSCLRRGRTDSLLIIILVVLVLVLLILSVHDDEFSENLV